VVLNEVGQATLVSRVGPQVGAQRHQVTIAQVIVEPLVVGVVEAELLQPVLEIPVDLGQQQEIRVAGLSSRDGPRPELGLRWLKIAAPGAPKHVEVDEHRHVAAHPVTALG
jgi:hypothetical protein